MKTSGEAEKKIIEAQILRNEEIVPGTYEMEVGSSWLGAKGQPGQFVNVKVAEDTTDPLLRIPLGIHKLRPEGISLLYKVAGKGTEILSRRSKGEWISILGPLGTGFNVKAGAGTSAPAIIVAGGHGIAPLFALAEQFVLQKKETVFFMGAKTQQDIVCVEALRGNGVTVNISTDDGSCGEKGTITAILEKYIHQNKEKNMTGGGIYSCGPLAMIKEVARIARDAGIPAEVTRDEYMACGIGACRGCAVETTEGIKMACTDGPVFDAAILKW